MPFPIFYRYMMREISALFLAITMILLTIIISFRFSSLLSRALDGSVSLAAIGQLLIFQTANIVVILLPVAFILASVMTLSRLYGDCEINALFAGGCSKKHLMQPILYLVLPLAVILVINTLYLLPHVFERWDQLMAQSRQEALYSFFTPNQFQHLNAHNTLYTGDKINNGFQPFIIIQNNNNEYSILWSKRGEIQKNQPEHFLHLTQGNRAAWRDDFQPQNCLFSQFTHGSLHLSQSPPSAQQRLRSIATGALNQSLAHRAEFQKRLNPALAVVIFSFAVPLLAHTRPRQGRYQRLLPAFILFGIYINLLDIALKMFSRGQIPFLIGGWGIHFAAAFIIAIYWQRARKP